MKTIPYPEDWIRRVDFLPPLLLQAKVDGDLELYHVDAVVSTSSTIPGVEEKLEFGKIKVDASMGNRVHYTKGVPDPRSSNSEPVTQKEILDDILSRGLKGEDGTDIPSVVIQQRGSVEQITDRVRAEVPPLQTSEHILRFEDGAGVYSKMLRRRLQVPLFDVYQYVKTELLMRGIIKNTNDPVLRQLRSVLKTQIILPEDVERGYNDLAKKLLTVEQSISREKWWAPIGTPIPFVGDYDHSLVKGKLVHLKKHGAFIIV